MKFYFCPDKFSIHQTKCIMKNVVLSLVGGLVLGAIITGFALFKMAPDMMLIESKSPYDFETTVGKFQQAIAKQGWKVPAVHDLQATMHNFGKTVGPVKVFELCHPDHAEKILRESEERIVSSMMPCRVAIYEKADGQVYLSRMNSKLMADAMGGIVQKVMADAFSENEQMIEATIR
jgi:uncharacterized protein (DUF302 family)